MAQSADGDGALHLRAEHVPPPSIPHLLVPGFAYLPFSLPKVTIRNGQMTYDERQSNYFKEEMAPLCLSLSESFSRSLDRYKQNITCSPQTVFSIKSPTHSAPIPKFYLPIFLVIPSKCSLCIHRTLQTNVTLPRSCSFLGVLFHGGTLRRQLHFFNTAQYSIEQMSHNYLPFPLLTTIQMVSNLLLFKS